MPQLQLPFFPQGSTQINAHLAVEKEDRNITYYNGLMPVFIHAEKDLATFRMITSQFCVNGNANGFGYTFLSLFISTIPSLPFSTHRVLLHLLFELFQLPVTRVNLSLIMVTLGFLPFL